jgi:hypothetical protein
MNWCGPLPLTRIITGCFDRCDKRGTVAAAVDPDNPSRDVGFDLGLRIDAFDGGNDSARAAATSHPWNVKTEFHGTSKTLSEIQRWGLPPWQGQAASDKFIVLDLPIVGSRKVRLNE